MNLLDEIQAHREGKVLTIPFKHSVLNKYIFIGKKMYHLVAGSGGTGKSAFIDLNYVINPYLYVTKHNPNFKLKIILRSMERSKTHRIAKWVCMKMYLNYGVLIDTKTMLGWGLQKSKITDELYEKIVHCYNEIEQMYDLIEIVDGVDNPTGGLLKNCRFGKKFSKLLQGKIGESFNTNTEVTKKLKSF